MKYLKTTPGRIPELIKNSQTYCLRDLVERKMKSHNIIILEFSFIPENSAILVVMSEGMYRNTM